MNSEVPSVALAQDRFFFIHSMKMQMTHFMDCLALLGTDGLETSSTVRTSANFFFFFGGDSALQVAVAGLLLVILPRR